MRMVRIRHMWMRVPQWLVTMPMAVWAFRHRDMHMVVVPVVVAVRVFVLRHIVSVHMAVRFRQVQHYSRTHQRAARRQECGGNGTKYRLGEDNLARVAHCQGARQGVVEPQAAVATSTATRRRKSAPATAAPA